MDEKLQQSEILPLIRSKVKERLTGSPAFQALPPEQRAAIAHDTVKALHYIVGGEDGTSRPSSMTLAGNAASFAQQGAQPAPQRAAAPAQGARKIVRPERIGNAARAGSQAFTDMIADVDFPAFVGGLIDGVFNSIVTTSIKQMEAYAELVKNVSKSVDQYMRDNVSEDDARDYLTEKYPDHLELDAAGDAPRVKPKEGADENLMPDFLADLGLKMPLSSLDEDSVEQELVPAARRRIAMDRQQLLATMVMMGVNRLVVTNGTIEASCLFELDTTDVRKRHMDQTGTTERDRTRGREWGGSGEHSRDRTDTWKGSKKWEGTNRSGDESWSGNQVDKRKSSWFNKGSSSDTAKFKMTTVKSQDSEESINMHAQLTGKVKVNFKSDYFPMEKMIDVLQINQIKEKSAAGIVPAAQPAPTPFAPPPMPQMPALPAMPALPGMPGQSPAPAPAPAAPAQPGKA